MPRYTDSNSKNLPNVVIEKTWYQIPLETNDTHFNVESYLIPPRVADYIELLELRVLENGLELPKLVELMKIK